MTTASACGKVILLGEHAVVYGRPAIAVPVSQVRAEAAVEPLPDAGDILLEAPDLGRSYWLSQADAADGIAHLVRLALKELGVPAHDLRITVRSELPIGRGMGSGAAVSTAIVRALGRHFGADWPAEKVSALVFEAEKLYHGTPSGIDNTVIAFEAPVYFIKGQPPALLPIGAPLPLLIADTGIFSSTREVVGAVREAHARAPERYEALFDAIGELVKAARQSLEAGDLPALGRLMDENHRLLQAIGVSCPELDALVQAAKGAGALGAKLSGAGRGGNMIVLVTPERAAAVEQALRAAGAVRVIFTRVLSPSSEQNHHAVA